MKKFLFLLVIPLLITSFFVFTNNVFAQELDGNDDPKVPHLNNPLGDNTTPQSVIGNVINAILGVVGSLTLLMFVYGGITWMTSSGAPEKVKKGKDILVWSVIGLAIIFFSYAMVNFVIFDIINAPSSNPPTTP
ncbi:MAG: pilin [Candidatus Pacebacteria bacterium]|nr:pilin [Candidatus Paceibacterota bacterium]